MELRSLFRGDHPSTMCNHGRPSPDQLSVNRRVVLREDYPFADFNEVIEICHQIVGKTKSRILSHWIMFFFPVISVCHPETAKVILKTSEPKPKQVGGGYFTLKDWIGDGLLMSDGKKWERNRRLLTPAFHFDVLKPYVGVFNDVCNIFLEKAEKATSGGKSVEMYELVGLATLDIIMRCSVSYDGKVQDQGFKHPYVNAIRRLTILSQERLMSPLLWYSVPFYLSPTGREYAKLTQYVHDFDEKIISERRKSLAADSSVLKKRHLDLLDIMLTAKDEHGIGLTDREVRDEVDTFLFEGQETPNSAVSWAIYALAKYPKEQEKVYEEVTRVLGDRQNVEWDDTKEFTRMSLFIKETLRMFPPVPFLVRVTTAEMDIDGVTIPVNTEINVMIFVMNHLEEVWDQPLEFRPDRFAGESNRDPYSYVPFAAGPRNCIGQVFALTEMKVMLARIVQRFRILPEPNHVPRTQKEFVTRAQNGIYIKLEKR
ncbi:cytochrome P450 4F1-like [Ylistrum balloti]|uniref:cytochrome P450 4F1-like n=1 Tax=Ylistrum balloti TaxID=509963 RepID=UPI002905AB58|nr:cytochrome P450 4F1-like [Ylistrum balloti]